MGVVGRLVRPRFGQIRVGRWWAAGAGNNAISYFIFTTPNLHCAVPHFAAGFPVGRSSVVSEWFRSDFIEPVVQTL